MFHAQRRLLLVKQLGTQQSSDGLGETGGVPGLSPALRCPFAAGRAIWAEASEPSGEEMLTESGGHEDRLGEGLAQEASLFTSWAWAWF